MGRSVHPGPSSSEKIGLCKARLEAAMEAEFGAAVWVG